MTQLHTFTPPDDTDEEEDGPFVKFTFDNGSEVERIGSVELDSEPVTVEPYTGKVTFTGTIPLADDKETDKQER